MNTWHPFYLFSDEEKNSWITKVNVYVDIIKDQLLIEDFVSFLTTVDSDQFNNYNVYNRKQFFSKGKVTSDSVSYLHTGSIPSQFGKPLMTLGHLEPTLLRSVK